jgi:predicted dehydrogenase/aryl-alcohol dehydrogenase-like predicted oxidoreductase
MPADRTTLRWGILGSGTMAKIYADALRHAEAAALVAVATRGAPSAEIAARFHGARVVSGYDALLADPEIDAVYIATPHPSHVQWAIRAAEAGKHVVCEKPIGVNAAEAMAAFEAARKAGTFMMEAFMYRFHPQTARLVDLVRAGEIGEVKLIRATFGFDKAFESGHRLYADGHAGGGILEVGCYTMSMVRLLAGAAAGESFLEPVKVVGTAKQAETGVDAVAVASVEFANGILAQLSTSIALDQDNVVHVIGTKGQIEIEKPWLAAGREGGTVPIRVVSTGGEVRIVAIDDPKWLYAHEIEAAGAAIRDGGQEVAPPGVSWADSIGNMRALDAWRQSIGLVFEFEKPEAARPPLAGRPLKFARTGRMRTRRMPGADKPVSVLAMGTADITSMTQVAALLDAYYEAGGNLFDTAWIYGAGRADRLLGHWLHSRGVRGDVLVIGKGAHSPLCYPDVISRQLDDSLERLKTGNLDVYMMHRDNPAIPVGEFVDAIDAEVGKGRIRSYGFSNWSLARFDEAVAYAERTGKVRPTSLSNNFSLAVMLEPVWAGGMSVSDDASKERLRRGDIGLYAWSSQARGFFTDLAGPDKRGNPELVRSWYSERNFERRRRTAELGEKRNKSLNQMALAYCLHQAFPVVPLIGPLTPGELSDSLGALEIELTPEEVLWLEA